MITSILIPPGIERNNTPYDTTGRWWDMNLVRWQSNTVRPIGGWTRTTATPLNGGVRKIIVYRDNTNNRRALVGTDNKLYTDDGGTYVDVTPSGFVPLSSIGVNGGFGSFEYGLYTYGDARPAPSPVFSPYAYWSFGNWGEDVILTANSDGRLFYYDSSAPTTAPTVISGAVTSVNAVVVTDERHVMAIGYSGSQRAVAWSTREDYTDWNFTSTTNTAGFQELTSRTPLLRGLKVKEGVLIFSYSDVILGRYVNQPFIYGFERISDTSLMHPDSIATFNGKAVWLSRSGFQLYNGGFVQPLECPVLDDVLGDMDPTYGPFRIHGCNHGLFPEVWWFYAPNGQTEATRYVIWNYAESWWAWGTLSRSAMAPAEVFKFPYMGASDGNIYQHEDGFTNAGSSRVGDVWIESGALGVGDGQNFVEVRQLLPALGTGSAPLDVTFYSRNTPNGTEQTFGPYSVRADGYCDTRVTGREARIRFAAKSDGDWGIGKMRLDVAAGSAR
jgi:hypothetical protein